MDVDDFEVFQGESRSPGHFRQGLGITLLKKGVLSLTGAAWEALGRPEFVNLLSDRQERMIGIRASDAADPYSYPARKVATGTARLVSGVSFLKSIDAMPKETIRLDATIVDGILQARLPS